GFPQRAAGQRNTERNLYLQQSRRPGAVALRRQCAALPYPRSLAGAACAPTAQAVAIGAPAAKAGAAVAIDFASVAEPAVAGCRWQGSPAGDAAAVQLR